MGSEGIGPKKWKTNSWFLLHDNAPAHRSVLVKDFLSNNSVTYWFILCTDLAPFDFYLLPWLKSALKGRRFCDVTDIIKNATEELIRLSQNGFQECFQHLYSRWQKCIIAQGGCFEGNVAEMIALLYTSQKWWFLEHFEANTCYEQLHKYRTTAQTGFLCHEKRGGRYI